LNCHEQKAIFCEKFLGGILIHANVIKPIDHISIDKQRDVLFVKFDYVPDSLSQDDHEYVLEEDSPWELMPVRNQLIVQ
jgi:hypothetical protein